jgi:hypothetical protein
LQETVSSTEPGWLQRTGTSGWFRAAVGDGYRSMGASGGLHTGREIMRGLDARFDRQFSVDGPYCFADLDGISEAAEQRAIDAGLIQATGFRCVGRLG